MRLARWLTILVVLACAGCSGSTSSEWDPQAAVALEQEPATMLKDLDAGNYEAMMARMDANPMVFDLDENGRPIKAEGMDEVRAMFERYKTIARERDFKFQSTLGKNQCFATSTMGYCLIEFDQTVTMAGQPVDTYKFRGTLIARKVGNEWKWTHWHGSFREMPPMAVPIPTNPVPVPNP